MNSAQMARKYRMLRQQSADAPETPTGTSRKDGQAGNLDFTKKMHDETETGILSIMNSMFSMQRFEKSGRETEGFKLAVIQWSSAYGVAYALMMTIAFSMLITRPLPPDQPADQPFHLKDWRFPSERVDTIMPLLYYFFAAAACCDSAWGMLICAEWGVRGGVVPADLYEEFVRNLIPDKKGNINTMWVARCCEPRAVHDGLPVCGCFCKWLFGPTLHFGFAQSPSWDPFYFIDRTVMELFLAAVCLVYLNNGVIPAGFVIFFFLSLRHRVHRQGQSVIAAMFKTLSDAAERDGIKLTAAEEATAKTISGDHKVGGLAGAAMALQGAKAAPSGKNWKALQAKARSIRESQGDRDVEQGGFAC